MDNRHFAPTRMGGMQGGIAEPTMHSRPQGDTLRQHRFASPEKMSSVQDTDIRIGYNASGGSSGEFRNTRDRGDTLPSSNMVRVRPAAQRAEPGLGEESGELAPQHAMLSTLHGLVAFLLESALQIHERQTEELEVSSHRLSGLRNCYAEICRVMDTVGANGDQQASGEGSSPRRSVAGGASHQVSAGDRGNRSVFEEPKKKPSKLAMFGNR